MDRLLTQHRLCRGRSEQKADRAGGADILQVIERAQAQAGSALTYAVALVGVPEQDRMPTEVMRLPGAEIERLNQAQPPR